MSEIILESALYKLGACLAIELDGDQWNKLRELLEAVNDEFNQLRAQLTERDAKIAELNKDVQVARGQYQGDCEIIRQLGTKITKQERTVEQAYLMLEINGVTKDRARTLANGIEVLASRFRKAANADAEQIAELQAKLEGEEPLSDTYIQRVPDKCDRIVWHNQYIHLPPKAEDAVEDFRRRAVEACLALINDKNSEQYCSGAMWASERIRALPAFEVKGES